MTWVEQGSKRTKTLQTEDNREEKLAASGGENSEKEIGDDSDQKTSLKRQKKMITNGRKKRKAPTFSMEDDTVKTLHLRIEQLEKQATSVEAVQAQMEGMGKQIKSLENELKLLKEKTSVEAVQSQMENMEKQIKSLENELKISKEKTNSRDRYRIEIPEVGVHICFSFHFLCDCCLHIHNFVRVPAERFH